MTGYAPARLTPLIDRSMREAADAGVIMLTADDVEYGGRYVEIEGQRLLNFGGCSYLGLEQRQELKQGAIDALNRYGTQFPFPRVYLEVPLYRELESTVEAMTGGVALLAPSTTLAHAAALPILVNQDDAVLIDRFAHTSLRMATSLLGAVPVIDVRHNDMKHLDHHVSRLSKTYGAVWYFIDGLYSMHGDFAPLADIAELLEKHPKLHVYVDDAHSTSWLGPNGRGFALEQLPDRSRVVVALSLNKAFAAAGAALIVPTREMKDTIRRCGGPMIFSGPIQPPMLGAALASAKLHLRPEFSDLQRGLVERIRLTVSLAQELRVPLANSEPSPIFFLRCGQLESLFPLAQALRQRGFYACPSGFPAVPREQSGIRFTVSLHNTESDIRQWVGTMAAEMKRLKMATYEEMWAPTSGTHRRSRTSSGPPPPTEPLGT